MNFNKSSLSFSKNNGVNVKAGVCQLLDIVEANEIEKYLRVLTNVGQNKKALFAYIE